MKGEITLLNHEFRNILLDVFKAGMQARDIQQGDKPAYISYSKACETYGRGNVENWIKWRKITPHKDGENNSKVRISVMELIACSLASHRAEYFTEKENLR